MSTPKFSVNESCVGIHLKGKMPYECKIMAIKDFNGKPHYHVHYVGWNTRYDFRVAVGKEDGRIYKGTLAAYKAAFPQSGSSSPSTSAAPVAKATPTPKPAAAPKASTSKAKPAAAPKPAKAKPVVKANGNAAAADEPSTSTATATAKTERKSRKAATPKKVPTLSQEAAANFTNQLHGNLQPSYDIGEEFVNIKGDEPCQSKVIDIKEHIGLLKYVCKDEGSTSEHMIRVGSEDGSMVKGKLADYIKKNGNKKKVNPKADNMPDEEDQPGPSSSTAHLAFKVGETCVCISAKDNTPHDAKIVAIKNQNGTQKYLVHFVGQHISHDETVATNATEGKLFKGDLKAYKAKHAPASPTKASKKRSAPETSSEAESSSAAGPSTSAASAPVSKRSKRNN